jgi:hypothetical protein
MSWHYAAVKQVQDIPVLGVCENWCIREVYFEGPKKTPKLRAWSKDPSVPAGDTLDELITDLEQMLSDAKRRKKYQLVQRKRRVFVKVSKWLSEVKA